MDLHWLFFFSIGFWTCWVEVAKTSGTPLTFFNVNVVCTLLFCFGIQLTMQNHKKSPWRRSIFLRHRVVFFFWGGCELDAKAEEQSADSIEEIDCGL
jgi:hypothetical protein